jgi:tripartite-type tricarboxylate transporter receptor subunit TctC
VIEPQDPHNLLFSFPGVTTVLPVLHEKLPFDPVMELLPISSTVHDFLALVVPASAEVSTLTELVTLARKAAGTLNWTTAPVPPT